MRPPTLKKALEGVLSTEELGYLKRAYDIIGDIAIIDIPEELDTKSVQIGDVLLSIHKNVNVVCKKAGIHDGEFRTQPLDVIAGENRKETEYKENGCRFLLNVETCYFSPRSSNERKRIAGLVTKGENVLVMFSGIGPFPIVIAKNAHPGSVYGIEKNEKAHMYAMQNKVRNKTPSVFFIQGDVTDIIPTLDRSFDRIVMPLPKTGEDFLEHAFPVLKERGVIHFYDFQNESEFDLAVHKVQKHAAVAGRRVIRSDVIVCGQYAPRVHRICVDARIGNV